MALGANLIARWLQWSARFAALQPREKHLIIGATVVAVLFGGFTLWVEPAQLHAKRLRADLVRQTAEQEQIRSQIAALAGQAGDPDAPNRNELKKLKEQMLGLERDIKGFDRVLLAPSQAPTLLQTLLARHRGVSLVSLTTLPPQPLIDAPEQKAAKEKSGERANTQKAPAVNLYKHGIEIKLSGSYLDLLAYVAELEAAPQKLLWGRLSFDANRYPVTELTLTVYSLSLESIWLVV